MKWEDTKKNDISIIFNINKQRGKNLLRTWHNNLDECMWAQYDM